jgi:alpha-methylacyl-CoA racemase
MTGALAGLRIIEFAGIGPGPFAAMMLADHGAEVIRIERPAPPEPLSDLDRFDVLARSRARLAIDMKTAAGRDVARDLCRGADGVVEGFRPGVMERLGLGPEILLEDNPALVYGRVTGWGQDGPLAAMAGHDINFIALNGVLDSIGHATCRPVPPVNYVGDFGGGGMLLAFGMTAALLSVARGGAGQVVDAAMVDGAALLSAMVWQLRAAGLWQDERGSNMLDGGAPFYDSYVCADGRHVAIGGLEPVFYARLRAALGVADDPTFDRRDDRSCWPELRARIAAIIVTRTRDEWCALLEGNDLCFTPVLSFDEALAHPHIRARGTFADVDGQMQPAPAPRFSATPAPAPVAALPKSGAAEHILAGIGYDAERIAMLLAARIVA